MIVVTGGLGFIGSCLITHLNNNGYENIVVVDTKTNDYRNIYDKKVNCTIHSEFFLQKWLDDNSNKIHFIYHLGAISDTTERDINLLRRQNTVYSQILWNKCVKYDIPIVYASSAATYGDGQFGYLDEDYLVDKLKPLNGYAKSKNDFDKWVLEQYKQPPFWAGLKFFNVYGPNEYHKGRMASVVYQAYNQIQKDNVVRLFKSDNEMFGDGEQLRDFVYVKDVVDVCSWFMYHRKNSGIFNVGTGNARKFSDLAKAVYNSLGKDPNIEYIDIPEDLKKYYQYFTEANIDKLRSIGYRKNFYSLEDGIDDYVKKYLQNNRYY